VPNEPSNETEMPPTQRRPASEDFPSGPGIGERLPDISLQDQHGNRVDIEAVRGNRRALVMFHRSLQW
jgi:hypothetical protein